MTGRRRWSSDEGITLVELLITMLLSTLVLLIIGSFFVQIVNATSKSNEARFATATAANIANELSDVIRPASTLVAVGSTKPTPAVAVGSANELVIYTYSDSVTSDIRPIRVRFALNAKNQLVESRWNATVNTTTGLWNFAAITTTPASTRTLPGTIVAPAAPTATETTATAPLFTYLDVNSAVVVPGGATLTDAQLETVASIRFTLRVRASTTPKAQVIVIQNVVGMPNLGL